MTAETLSSGRIARLRAALEAALAPESLEIRDDGDRHIGHPGAREGGHFHVTIVARAFDGRSLAAYLQGRRGAQPPREWIFCQYHKRRTVRDERFKLYTTGELYDVDRDPAELQNLAESDNPQAAAAQARLRAVLDSLPPDSPPPFKLRSQSAFKLESEGKL